MKKIRIVSIVLILLSIIVIGVGIALTFLNKDEKEVKDHTIPEKTLCESIDYTDSASFTVTDYYTELDSVPESILLTSWEDFYQELYLYEYPEDLDLDFDSYNYFVYFIDNSSYCIKEKYLSNYSYSNNTLNLEFTNISNISPACSYMSIIGYGIPIDKDIDIENTTINYQEKEDPYKECYD